MAKKLFTALTALILLSVHTYPSSFGRFFAGISTTTTYALRTRISPNSHVQLYNSLRDLTAYKGPVTPNVYPLKQVLDTCYQQIAHQKIYNIVLTSLSKNPKKLNSLIDDQLIKNQLKHEKIAKNGLHHAQRWMLKQSNQPIAAHVPHKVTPQPSAAHTPIIAKPSSWNKFTNYFKQAPEPTLAQKAYYLAYHEGAVTPSLFPLKKVLDQLKKQIPDLELYKKTVISLCTENKPLLQKLIDAQVKQQQRSANRSINKKMCGQEHKFNMYQYAQERSSKLLQYAKTAPATEIKSLTTNPLQTTPVKTTTYDIIHPEMIEIIPAPHSTTQSNATTKHFDYELFLPDTHAIAQPLTTNHLCIPNTIPKLTHRNIQSQITQVLAEPALQLSSPTALLNAGSIPTSSINSARQLLKFAKPSPATPTLSAKQIEQQAIALEKQTRDGMHHGQNWLRKYNQGMQDLAANQRAADKFNSRQAIAHEVQMHKGMEHSNHWLQRYEAAVQDLAASQQAGKQAMMQFKQMQQAYNHQINGAHQLLQFAKPSPATPTLSTKQIEQQAIALEKQTRDGMHHGQNWLRKYNQGMQDIAANQRAAGKFNSRQAIAHEVQMHKGMEHSNHWLQRYEAAVQDLAASQQAGKQAMMQFKQMQQAYNHQINGAHQLLQFAKPSPATPTLSAKQIEQQAIALEKQTRDGIRHSQNWLRKYNQGMQDIAANQRAAGKFNSRQAIAHEVQMHKGMEHSNHWLQRYEAAVQDLAASQQAGKQAMMQFKQMQQAYNHQINSAHQLLQFAKPSPATPTLSVQQIEQHAVAASKTAVAPSDNSRLANNIKNPKDCNKIHHEDIEVIPAQNPIAANDSTAKLYDYELHVPGEADVIKSNTEYLDINQKTNRFSSSKSKFGSGSHASNGNNPEQSTKTFGYKLPTFAALGSIGAYAWYQSQEPESIFPPARFSTKWISIAAVGAIGATIYKIICGTQKDDPSTPEEEEEITTQGSHRSTEQPEVPSEEPLIDTSKLTPFDLFALHCKPMGFTLQFVHLMQQSGYSTADVQASQILNDDQKAGIINLVHYLRHTQQA